MGDVRDVGSKFFVPRDAGYGGALRWHSFDHVRATRLSGTHCGEEVIKQALPPKTKCLKGSSHKLPAADFPCERSDVPELVVKLFGPEGLESHHRDRMRDENLHRRRVVKRVSFASCYTHALSLPSGSRHQPQLTIDLSSSQKTSAIMPRIKLRFRPYSIGGRVRCFRDSVVHDFALVRPHDIRHNRGTNK